MKRKKNGFTFVELMAVIVVIGIILVLVVPSLLGNMNEAKEQTEIVFVKNIDKSINNFIAKHKNEFKVDTESEYSIAGTDVYKVTKSDGNNYKFNDLKVGDFVNPKNSNSCDLNAKVELYRDINFKYYYRYNLECLDVAKGNFSELVIKSSEGESGENNNNNNNNNNNDNNDNNTIINIPGANGDSVVIKKDDSGANAPDLDTGLVPVRYNGTNWVIIDPEEEQWYDYDKQEWANAVSLAPGVSKEVGTKLTVPDGTSTDSDILAMFVWIPRYSYTIGCTSTDSCLGYKVPEASALSLATPGAIDIKFVDKDTTETYTGDAPTYTYTSEADRNPINWYTHLAFNFGNDKLTGIWVGKFETSVNPNSTCYNNLINLNSSASSNCVASKEDVTPRILPNVLSLVYQNVYNEFETAKKFSSNLMYALTTNTDSHMMKNSEWAAVAYLSQSIYGKYGNPNYKGTNKEIYKNDSGTTNFWSRYTGRSQGLAPATSSHSDEGTYKYDDISTTDETKVVGSGTGASTSGNIYGIYDMSGGAHEYVMANHGVVKDGGFTGTESFSGIRFEDIDIKFYDKFTSREASKVKSNETIGQAYAETIGWYSDLNAPLGVTFPWIYRGGYYKTNNGGILFVYSDDGDSNYSISFRSVLVSNN